MKKAFRKIHLWLSIPFGIIIMLICLSGASLVFESEITRVLQHDTYYVRQQTGETVPIDRLAATVAATLDDGVEITGVTVFSDPERTYQVNLSKPFRSAVFVDQYSGEIRGRTQRPAFFDFMFRMHRWLLGGMNPSGGVSVGKLLVGISTLMFVIVLISGVVIWWPKTRDMLKRRLKISVSKGWGKFWHDLHVAGGLYVTLFLLLMALTGLTWSFDWYRTGFYKVFGVETQAGGGHSHGKPGGGETAQAGGAGEHRGGRNGAEGVSDRRTGDARPAHAEGENRAAAESGHDRGGVRGEEARTAAAERPEEFKGADRAGGRHAGERGGEEAAAGAPGEGARRHAGRPADGDGSLRGGIVNFAHWQEVFEQLAEQNSGYRQITVGPGTASVSSGSCGNQRAADSYTFDRRSGQITSTALYKDSDRAGKLRGWIFSLHVGSWGGMLTRILAFLAALVGATLPVTGYWLWLRRLVHKGDPHGHGHGHGHDHARAGR